MVKRQLSVRRYLIAGIITTLIFILGFLLGMIIDYERIQYLESQYAVHELDYRSLQLQFSLLDLSGHDERSCAAFDKVMESSVAELSTSLEEVERYQDFSTTQNEEFTSIERRYTLDNIRYWLIVREAQELCPIDRLTVLYFFSLENCPNCPDQGVILTYFKKRFGDSLLVFPINTDIAADEPIISVIQSRYNVTTYPSIVIGDAMYSGVVEKDQLAPLICVGLGRDPEECS